MSSSYQSGKIFKNIFTSFPLNQIILKTKYERWKIQAKLLKLSPQASLRLSWMIYLQTKAQRNTLKTIRHFGISNKTFYKWLKRFDEANLLSLEDRERKPKRTRQREYTPLQYERVVSLRKKYIRQSKFKILARYKCIYPQDHAISAWKIQCIIKHSGLYYHPKKQARINRKRALSQKRKKITDLKKKKVSGFLLCMDTIVIYFKSKKLYIVTAIDRYSRIAFARMYPSKSSRNTSDFLLRLNYLMAEKIENVQTDNGSEFKKEFEHTLKRLSIDHYLSRNHTPKDNACCERFNRTLQEEFIQLGNLTDNIPVFNQRLTEWLIDYNFKRPHQALGYMPPINFSFQYHKVLPMYPSSTPS